MGWLSGWAKRVKLTADSGVIDTDLTNFPALLYISGSSGKNTKDLTFVFDEVGANRKKIAVTKSDGTTQCYVEIEKWDSANEKAWLFAKHPTLDGDADEDYYLYFDNTHADNTTYVGDPESTPAQNVWDGNFKMIQHMQDYDAGHIHDSTANNNDGTKKAANEPNQVDGKIAKAQDFDGANDYIVTGNPSGVGTSYSVSLWVKRNGTPASIEYLLMQAWNATNNPYPFELFFTTSGYIRWYLRDPSLHSLTGTINVCDNAFHRVKIVRGIAGTGYIYIDGSLDVSRGMGSSNSSSTQPVYIGSRSELNNNLDGIMGELRISDDIRSAAWGKASYNSENDSLWTWGDEEEAVTTYYATINSNARVKITQTPATISGNARIKIAQSQTVTGNARIKKEFTKTVTGNAKIVIAETHYQTIGANARIKVPTSKTITGAARVKKTFAKTVNGNATVVFRKHESIGADARIKVPQAETITGNARIKKEFVETITSAGRVLITSVAAIDGTARIKVPSSQTVTGNARIKAAISKTISGNARIEMTRIKTVTGNATVVFRQRENEIAGNARIKVTSAKTITGNASIVVGRHWETIAANASIESIQRYETPLSYRFDRETKARAIAGVANSICYEWWVDEIGGNDTLHFYDQRGHDKSAVITLSDEIVAFDNSGDATKIINKLTVIGMGPGSTHLEVTVGTGEMEGTFSAKNIHDIDTLTSYANAMLDQTKQAKHRMMIELAGTERTDIELGDVVHVTYPDAGIDGNYRIISMERVSGVAGESTKLEVAVPQFRVTETLMDAKRRLDAEDYHPQGAPSILTLARADNVDSTHPLKMKFYVPPEAVDMGKLQIKEAKVALTLEPFRAYSTGAESGGGQTSQEGLPHTHTISAQTAASRDLGTKTAQSKDLGTKTAQNKDLGDRQSTSSGGLALTGNEVTYMDGTTHYGVTVYDAFYYMGALTRDIASMNKDVTEIRHKHYCGDHVHHITIGAHDHNVPIGSHDHSVPIGTHDHSVTGATAQNESAHTHEILAHTHNIVYGIYTSTYPTSVYIKLNGTQIAGPFSADEYVDITIEFLDKITTYGWNTLEFTSTQLGKIGATLFMRLFLQAS